jgi:hypothetical protein
MVEGVAMTNVGVGTTFKMSVPLLGAPVKSNARLGLGVKAADRVWFPPVVSAEVEQVATPADGLPVATALQSVVLVVVSVKVTLPAAAAVGVVVAVRIRDALEFAALIGVVDAEDNAAVSVVLSGAAVTVTAVGVVLAKVRAV